MALKIVAVAFQPRSSLEAVYLQVLPSMTTNVPGLLKHRTKEDIAESDDEDGPLDDDPDEIDSTLLCDEENSVVSDGEKFNELIQSTLEFLVFSGQERAVGST